jgi:hypothetical protein
MQSGEMSAAVVELGAMRGHTGPDGTVADRCSSRLPVPYSALERPLRPSRRSDRSTIDALLPIARDTGQIESGE